LHGRVLGNIPLSRVPVTADAVGNLCNRAPRALDGLNELLGGVFAHPLPLRGN